jgi:hypothetical protein
MKHCIADYREKQEKQEHQNTINPLVVSQTTGIINTIQTRHTAF